ncbi:MAG: hypothetical protein RLZZ463_1491 [Bacteroidota bacterium]
MYLSDFKKHGLLWAFAALLMLGLVQCTSEAAAEPAPRMLRTEVIVDRGVKLGDLSSEERAQKCRPRWNELLYR